MGFPTWTLYGMGACALLAIVVILLSLLSQSPRSDSAGTAQQARRTYSFTGWGLAFLLLAFGFFIAGVPIGQEPAVIEIVVTATIDPIAVVEQANSNSDSGFVSLPTTTPLPPTPRSGASGATLPTNTPRPSPEAEVEEVATPESEEAVVEAATESDASTEDVSEEVEPTEAPTEAVEPTETPTIAPTTAPLPEFEPTPIEGRTGVVTTVGSTLGLRRVPDGASYVQLQPETLVLVLSGVANINGVLWQEVSTLQGETGWVPAQWVEIDG